MATRETIACIWNKLSPEQHLQTPGAYALPPPTLYLSGGVAIMQTRAQPSPGSHGL